MSLRDLCSGNVGQAVVRACDDRSGIAVLCICYTGEPWFAEHLFKRCARFMPAIPWFAGGIAACLQVFRCIYAVQAQFLAAYDEAVTICDYQLSTSDGDVRAAVRHITVEPCYKHDGRKQD